LFHSTPSSRKLFDGGVPKHPAPPVTTTIGIAGGILDLDGGVAQHGA
jgi:hypothetical protein